MGSIRGYKRGADDNQMKAIGVFQEVRRFGMAAARSDSTYHPSSVGLGNLIFIVLNLQTVTKSVLFTRLTKHEPLAPV